MNESRAPILIRIRASLKERIGELAKREHRSTNQQIEFLLELALRQVEKAPDRLRIQKERRGPKKKEP